MPTPQPRQNLICTLKPAELHGFTRGQDLIILGLNLYRVYKDCHFIAFWDALEPRVCVLQSEMRCPWEGLQQLENITQWGKSGCCISGWPPWQVLGTMEEKDCKVADFLNCFPIFKPPLSRLNQTFCKVSVIKPEIQVFSLEGTWSIQVCLDKWCCTPWGVLCFSFNWW